MEKLIYCGVDRAPNLARDLFKASYRDGYILIKLHLTGNKHYITLKNCATGAFEVSKGYLSFEQAHAAYTRIVERMASGYDYAALVKYLNS